MHEHSCGELSATPAGGPAARPLFVEPLRPIVLADMVKPGQTAIRLFDRLQVVATVRESLAKQAAQIKVCVGANL